MKPTWIVVVGKAKASVYECAPGQAALKQILEIDNPKGLLRERELVSDRPGRASHNRHGQRNPLPRRQSATETLQVRFVNHVADQLTAQFHKKRFENVHLIAEPHTLGLLRKAIGSHKGLAVLATLPQKRSESIKGQLRQAKQRLTRRGARS
ncbi:MAG: host attachment protein [Bdellovibrionota bacterium]|nr:MAG: host attachment protein [Bdellovibrionota bacterium]